MCGLLAVGAGDFRPSPHFTGNALPAPPLTSKAWKAPASTLPPKVVDAAASLFDQGMADPRGLEYREVETGVGNVWAGDGGIVKTHAWAFPASATPGSQRFAVAWNGLVYPVVTVGEKADLKADVDQIEKNSHSSSAAGSTNEAHNIAPDQAGSTRVCLLIRLGEMSFAERLWKASASGDANDDDPYMSMANEWLFARFDRAVCAHMRGDDHLAAADCAELVRLKDAVIKEGIRRKLIDVGDDGKPAGNSQAPDFLDGVPQLLADEQRRIAQPPRKRALDLGREAFKTNDEWIAALVNDLDEVFQTQQSQPGGVDLGSDPVVAALIAAGDDAVEPLLNCFEKDTRLTRSVHFGRDFSYYRSLIGVHEAAYVALCNILQESFFEIRSTGDDLSANGLDARQAIGKQMRDYWKAFHGLSLPERWYRILKDDKQDPQRWASAADNITQRQDENFTRDSMFAWTLVEVHEYKPGEVLKLQGDVLRNKANPSVSQLLVKRLRALEELRPGGFDPNGSGLHQILVNAVSVATALQKWDGKANLPELKEYCQYLDNNLTSGGQTMWTAMRLTEMYAARVRLGDPGAMEEFTRFLRGAGPDGRNLDHFHLFDDAWKFPDDPVMQKCMEDLFNGPKSPWNPIVRTNGTEWFRDDHLISSPLLGFAGFRKQALRMLADTSVAGSGTIREDGKVDVGLNRFQLYLNEYNLNDPRVPAPGSKVSYRVCDVYAYYLQRGFSTARGLPLMDLWWRLEERDRAVKRCTELLVRYGDRFKFSPDHTGFDDDAVMSFPPLNHPASPDEVNAGRAIFTLARAGESVREWKLPVYPERGNWLKSNAIQAGDKEPIQVANNENDGLIWQAEEVLKNGKWQRYYGFVGHHDVARVPAKEIELGLPGDSPWSPLSHQISCAMMTPPVDYSVPTRGVSHLRVGDPLPIAAALGNRRGLSQTLPTAWFQPNANGGGALRPGVSIKLLYAPRTPDDGTVWNPDPADKSWTEVKSKPSAAWNPDLVTRDLEAGEAFEVMRIDLRDFFDLSRPGSYRVQILFNVDSNGFSVNGASHVVQFTLSPKAGDRH
ncbi:MAG TPA: hypothetical protein VFE47_07945 [Tepidisphaeraceae bacterium]|nr:hypothetical protein [Tepidisphaeraceae bacterium]